MSFPFTPGLTEPKIVDLSDPTGDLLLNATREELTQAVRSGDVEALSRIEGSFAAYAKEGVTIRLARTLGRPLRYFVAKRETGPYLVVADRIDAIARYCRESGIAWQFHPSYTRLVPAHILTELDQVGCPDPNPRYRRFFEPQTGWARPSVEELGDSYLSALAATVALILDAIPREAPLGVAFSGGADSSAVAALLCRELARRGETERLRLFTLSVGGGGDRDAAGEVVRALGAGGRWEAIEAPAEDLDLAAAVACLEDYRPLDVACGAALRALLKNLRLRHPELVHLFDGDGGDENWKSYPVEDSDLTIKSVLNNPLLYHEGWGVDSIKHSQTYSGGLSRGAVRGFAPAREFGFRLHSPHAERRVIAAALAAPLRELVGESLERLSALKGEVIAAGLRRMGLDLPIASKRRFQEGATSSEIFAACLRASRADLRRLHESRFGEFEESDAGQAPASPSRPGFAGETAAS
jgi:asparagine synthase (glutamine-hydrolysing)